MTASRDYFQYQCDQCGFRARSPDKTETIQVVNRHETEYHNRDRDRDEIVGELRELELEGLPDNS